MVYNVSTQLGRYNTHARNLVPTRGVCWVRLMRTIKEAIPLSWGPNPALLPSKSSSQRLAAPRLDVFSVSMRVSASLLPLCHPGSWSPVCWYFPLELCFLWCRLGWAERKLAQSSLPCCEAPGMTLLSDSPGSSPSVFRMVPGSLQVYFVSGALKPSCLLTGSSKAF